MAEAKTPAKVQPESAQPPAPGARDFFGSLHHEIERVFEDFDKGMWGLPSRWRGLRMEPVWRPKMPFAMTPSVDICEKDDMYEVTADLPGLDEKNVEVALSGDMLTIKGQREEKKEEKKKDYYVSERQFGAFERSFHIPDEVETGKIEAKFKNGVLTVSLPKKPGAIKAEKKIGIKQG